MMPRSVKGLGLLGAGCERNHLKEKMAEKHLESGPDGYVTFSLTVATTDLT